MKLFPCFVPSFLRVQKITVPSAFSLKIVALNKQVLGTAEVGNFWGKEPLPKHKNVRIQVELFNDAIIRNLIIRTNEPITEQSPMMKARDDRRVRDEEISSQTIEDDADAEASVDAE